MERWWRWAVGCCGQDSTYSIDIFSAPSLKQYKSQSRIFDQGRDTDHGASLVLGIFLAQSTGIASLKKPTTHNIDFESVIMLTSHQQKEMWALDFTHHPSSASSRPKSNKCIFVPGGQFKAGTPALESHARAPLLEPRFVIFEIKQFQTCPLAEESVCESWDGTSKRRTRVCVFKVESQPWPMTLWLEGWKVWGKQLAKVHSCVLDHGYRSLLACPFSRMHSSSHREHHQPDHVPRHTSEVNAPGWRHADELTFFDGDKVMNMSEPEFNTPWPITA